MKEIVAYTGGLLTGLLAAYGVTVTWLFYLECEKNFKLQEETED